MTKSICAEVNKQLKAQNIDLEMVRANEGYYYFIGAFEVASIMVPKIVATKERVAEIMDTILDAHLVYTEGKHEESLEADAFAARIINSAQITAIANAMSHLNNINAYLSIRIGAIEIDDIDGSISVVQRDRPQGLRIVAREDYVNQAAFLEAYCL